MPPITEALPTEALAHMDWRIAIGSNLPRGLLVVLCAAAGFALAFSAVSLLWERRRGRAGLLLALRALAIAACLLVACSRCSSWGRSPGCPTTSRCWSTPRAR